MVFPDPLGPIKPKMEARGTSNETSCTTVSSANFFVKCLTLMTASIDLNLLQLARFRRSCLFHNDLRYLCF